MRECKAKGLPAPARNTVALRIGALRAVLVGRRRKGPDALRPLQAAGGIVPEISAPLEQVQIDHTVMDLMIVDECDRAPIGRPHLMVAIDVYSCCLLGMVVTVEAPPRSPSGCALHTLLRQASLVGTANRTVSNDSHGGPWGWRWDVEW